MFIEKKHRCIIVSILLTTLLALPAWAGLPFTGTKVGYINLGRLVKESKMGQQASERIEALKNEKQVLISAKLKSINAIKLDLETNAEELKDAEKKDKVDVLNSLIKEYKRMRDDAKEELAKQDRELVAKILEKADGALHNIAKKKGFAIILKDPQAIGYLDPKVDITDDVLSELNK